MTKRATPKAIAEYREKLLTNPVTFGQRLQQVREDLRARSEVLFIDRDLTEADKAIDEDARTTELDRLDEMILRVGARIDDLDKQIEAHNKAHPDAELAAKLMPQGTMAGSPAVSRQQRRALERTKAKAEKNLPVLPSTDSVPVEGDAESPAEEAPEAEE